jgi:uncharacterized membrane protein
MTAATLTDTVALGALSGMRSMAGALVLGRRRGGAMQQAAMAMAAAEMLADKTPLVGDRIDPLPLTGRAVMGALVGGLLARQDRASVFAGAMIGAASAVIAAHAAYRLRTRLPLSNIAGGLLEDAVVLGISGVCGDRRAERRSSQFPDRGRRQVASVPATHRRVPG